MSSPYNIELRKIGQFSIFRDPIIQSKSFLEYQFRLYTHKMKKYNFYSIPLQRGVRRVILCGSFKQVLYYIFMYVKTL